MIKWMSAMEETLSSNGVIRLKAIKIKQRQILNRPIKMQISVYSFKKKNTKFVFFT